MTPPVSAPPSVEPPQTHSHGACSCSCGIHESSAELRCDVDSIKRMSNRQKLTAICVFITLPVAYLHACAIFLTLHLFSKMSAVFAWILGTTNNPFPHSTQITWQMFAEHMHIYVGRGMSQAGGATSHPGQNAPAAAAGGKLSDRKTVSTGGQQDITVQTGARFSWYLRRIQFPAGLSRIWWPRFGDSQSENAAKDIHTRPTGANGGPGSGNRWSHSLHVSANRKALNKSIIWRFRNYKVLSTGKHYSLIRCFLKHFRI